MLPSPLSPPLAIPQISLPPVSAPSPALPSSWPALPPDTTSDSLSVSDDSRTGVVDGQFKLWDTKGKHDVKKARYATSTDSRGFIPVFEYPLRGQTILVDSETGYILITAIWKVFGKSKADVVKLIESQPEIAPLVRKVRGGQLTIQGTWLPFEIAETLAKRVAWEIKDDLIPLFGPSFPSSCLSPSSPGFGFLTLSTLPSSSSTSDTNTGLITATRRRRDPIKVAEAKAAAIAAQNNPKRETSEQAKAGRELASAVAAQAEIRSSAGRVNAGSGAYETFSSHLDLALRPEPLLPTSLPLLCIPPPAPTTRSHHSLPTPLSATKPYPALYSRQPPQRVPSFPPPTSSRYHPYCLPTPSASHLFPNLYTYPSPSRHLPLHLPPVSSITTPSFPSPPRPVRQPKPNRHVLPPSSIDVRLALRRATAATPSFALPAEPILPVGGKKRSTSDSGAVRGEVSAMRYELSVVLVGDERTVERTQGRTKGAFAE